jgi:hypothetical protein
LNVSHQVLSQVEHRNLPLDEDLGIPLNQSNDIDDILPTSVINSFLNAHAHVLFLTTNFSAR